MARSQKNVDVNAREAMLKSIYDIIVSNFYFGQVANPSERANLSKLS